MTVCGGQECFFEEVNARASDNKLLFRFGILEPKTYDLLDVQVRAPSSFHGSSC